MSAKGTRKRSRFKCLDCNLDTGKLKEFYFIHTPLWRQANPAHSGMLCVACIEKRLGRRLNHADFTDAYINNPHQGEKSARLLDRLLT